MKATHRIKMQELLPYIKKYLHDEGMHDDITLMHVECNGCGRHMNSQKLCEPFEQLIEDFTIIVDTTDKKPKKWWKL